MDVTEFTFNNSRYHQFDEMRDWCVEHFGTGEWMIGELTKPWGCSSNFGFSSFCFQSEKDAMLFALRWL